VNHCHNRELARALEALSLAFPDRLAWMGEPVPVVTGSNARPALIDTITSLLYSQFYCYGRPVPLPTRDPGRQALAGGRFIERLRLASQESARWTRGWRVVEASDKGVRIARGGLRMSVAKPEEYREIGHGEVEVRFAPESLSASPGYFVVQSPEPLVLDGAVRLYWNTAQEGAVALVERVTGLLRGAAYQVKVLTSFALGERADSSVLYLGRLELMRFVDALSRIYGDIQGSMRVATPAFTLPLAPGLALAENPRNGGSFGRDRCELVAEALVDMAQEGQRIELEGVARHFVTRGLRLERPYLGEGSQQRYSLPIGRSIAAAEARTAVSSDRDLFLRMAVRVGDYLVRSAIWSRNACNWHAELRSGGYGALAPTLYSGTSGIAWFLAELYRACGDERFGRTASAALSHACRGIESQRHAHGNGLYSGAAGVAYAAWRCASLLDRPDLLDQSQRIFKRVLHTPGNCPAPDVISGEAGMILALAAAGSNASGIEGLGRTLVTSARRARNTFSWRTGNAKRSPNLTGFSHGTAGIAAALLVLYEQTGRVEFRSAADGAIRYERTCFNEVERNWPDYRAAPASYTVAWCHGAPGIALSRALAVRVCGPEAGYMGDLAAALDTTRAAIASFAPGTDFSLCHGITGNADILQLVGRVEDRALVEQAAVFVMEKYGTFAEKPPGLMTGCAGAGQFYLRLADANVPSPLWIGPSLGGLT
jgi:hypothetical protein